VEIFNRLTLQIFFRIFWCENSENRSVFANTASPYSQLMIN